MTRAEHYRSRNDSPESSDLLAVKCQCGAVSVEDERAGWSNSMKYATFKKEFPGVKLVRKQRYYSCNHCVNGYGIDICGCGSGEPVGKCRNGFRECKAGVASQEKAVKMPSLMDIMAARGGF